MNPLNSPQSPILQLEQTQDGSPTLYNVTLGEHYHSVHGALQESLHIFLGAGLTHRSAEGASTLSVLEVGFGTGLNALLTLLYAEDKQRQIRYTTLERYPISLELAEGLHFDVGGYTTDEVRRYTQALHAAPWNTPMQVTPHFSICKQQCDLRDYEPDDAFDIIYFDAFSPETQPELWTEEIFQRLYSATAPQGVLTTYCAKGEVRRRMQRVGYTVERLPGPKGKREILRATK